MYETKHSTLKMENGEIFKSILFNRKEIQTLEMFYCIL